MVFEFFFLNIPRMNRVSRRNMLHVSVILARVKKGFQFKFSRLLLYKNSCEFARVEKKVSLVIPAELNLILSYT